MSQGIQQIKQLHVYDFDNTLFGSPLPNKQLWSLTTVGQLQTQQVFHNGGWWHDSNILASTGEGVAKEEPRAWKGWWNETIVSLVQLSMQQKDSLNVLLTGRSESGFAHLIQRIARSKKLEFHMICLKPEVGPANQKFASTMKYKQAFLEDLICTYQNAEEIRIYEDRPKHVAGFREYLHTLNQGFLSENSPHARKPITAEVIEVAEQAVTLDPVTEVAEVQRMINAHNIAYRDGISIKRSTVPWKIQRQVFYTGYLVAPSDTEKLATLVNLPPETPDGEWRFLANSIVILPRPCPRHILDKVGGIGKRVRWRVTGTSLFRDKIWAAKVEPVPLTERVWSESLPHSVVLALRRTARPHEANRIQNWQPVPPEKAIEFETVVGEKVILKLEEERPAEEDVVEVHAVNGDMKRGYKRPLQAEDNFPQLGSSHSTSKDVRSAGHDSQSDTQYRSNQNDENRRLQGNGSSSHRGTSNGNRGGRRDQRYDSRNGVGRSGRSGYSRGGGGIGGAQSSGRGRGRGGYGSYRSLDDGAVYGSPGDGGGLSY